MSKKIYLFSLVLLALAFVSCSETEEVGKYDNWRARNEAFIYNRQIKKFPTEKQNVSLKHILT